MPVSNSSFRSIPAWAGETRASPACVSNMRVYPRVGGGNLGVAECASNGYGLSPRGRGKLPCAGRAPFEIRSIPAWAGETIAAASSRSFSVVYPRVGGGNGSESISAAPTRGLSPRGRGKHKLVGRDFLARRSIPAWAGETFRSGCSGTSLSVYPRVGGGNGSRRATDAAAKGLSPRGRGKPPAPIRSARSTRSIPAWAGETGCLWAALRGRPVYPRVGGGNAGLCGTAPSVPGLSPRGRGKPDLHRQRQSQARSIPAWAGETAPSYMRFAHTEVYPRVGGGNCPYCGADHYNDGLSPRGRGKLRRYRHTRTEEGSIPAWAGETPS